MKKGAVLFFMFYYVNCIFSFEENTLDLGYIYNEIVSRHFMWESLLNEYDIVINYSDGVIKE